MKNGLIEIAKPLERMSGFCQTKSTDALMTLVYDLIISTSSKNKKNTLRKKREQFTQNQLKKIEESIDSNNFWKNWNTLNKKKHEELAIQDGEIWKSHFENLYSKCGRNPEQTEIYQKMIDMENTINEYQNPLDYPITDTELTEKLQGLQPKKACGPDGILNEMLTNISHNLRLAILK